jgi:hypothetical protein
VAGGPLAERLLPPVAGRHQHLAPRQHRHRTRLINHRARIRWFHKAEGTALICCRFYTYLPDIDLGPNGMVTMFFAALGGWLFGRGAGRIECDVDPRNHRSLTSLLPTLSLRGVRYRSFARHPKACSASVIFKSRLHGMSEVLCTQLERR